MSLILAMMAGMIFEEQARIRVECEAARQRRREEQREQLLAAFEADRLVRRNDDGTIKERKKRAKSRNDWLAARANIQRCYYAAIPVFNDKQFTQTFRVTRNINCLLFSGTRTLSSRKRFIANLVFPRSIQRPSYCFA
jgi:hypothetical protein